MTNPLPAWADAYPVEERKNNGGLWNRYIRYLTDELPGCSDVIDLGGRAVDPGTEKVPQT